MNFLSIDIGTTGCKCQLFYEDGTILTYLFREYDFKRIDNYNYVDIDAIKEHLQNMIGIVSKDYEKYKKLYTTLKEFY